MCFKEAALRSYICIDLHANTSHIRIIRENGEKGSEAKLKGGSSVLSYPRDALTYIGSLSCTNQILFCDVCSML